MNDDLTLGWAAGHEAGGPSPEGSGRMALFHRGAMVMLSGALTLSLVASAAAADVMSRRDPKDTPGRLDIRRLAHAHKGEDLFVHLITMHRRFPSKMLHPRGAGQLEVLLYEKKNLRDGTLTQLISRVQIVWRNGRLRGPIFDELAGGHFPKRVGTARVTRPDLRTVRVVIPRKVLGDLQDPPVYLWAVASSFHDNRKCRSMCWDLAPNGALVSHRVE